MSDLITRQSAIEAVWKPKVKPEAEIFNALKMAIQSEIEHVPSAERNCYTCGMVDGAMKFRPERVSDETLEEHDRLVRLSDVCKLIQSEWEINPHQWGSLAALPEVNPAPDLVSRKEIISYIDHVSNQGTGKHKSLEYIRKYVECMLSGVFENKYVETPLIHAVSPETVKEALEKTEDSK